MLEAHRVLLIRPSALGDVCRTVPALVSLRRAMPRAHIDWLVRDSFADAVAHHPMLDGVVSFDRRGLRLIGGEPDKSFWRFAKQLKRGKYDLAVDLQGLARSGLFSFLTRAPVRLGYANAAELGWLGYNQRHRVDAKLHAVDRMLGLLEAAGIPTVRDMRLYVGDEDAKWAEQWLAEQKLVGSPYACLAPTARWRCKCWPIEKYLEVGKRLLSRGDLGERLVVLASPSEAAEVQPLMQAMGERAVLPRTTVGQAMALIARSGLVVCNDSAPLHMAVGFARPLVAVFGPTEPALVGPYEREETVVRPEGMSAMSAHAYRRQRDDQSLIAQVSVDAVWERIAQQLAGDSRAPSQG